MKIRSMFAAFALTCSAVPLAAQSSISPKCSSTITQDACQKTIDIFRFIAPQLGTIIAGGNATLGVGGTLGGPGHIYISGRANLVDAELPLANDVAPSTSGARSDEYSTQSQFAGIPEADVAIGLFRGFPVGVTNIGGIDLLGSVSYMPSLDGDGLKVGTPNGSFKFGGGVRVGIVQESLIFPGIAVTYLHRALPTVNLLTHDAPGDTLRVDNLDISTDSYRIVASKNLLLLGLAAGIGQDRYNTSATGSAYVSARDIDGIGTPAASVGPISLNQKINRTTYFVDATINLPLFKIIGEVGRTNAVTVPTYNTFVGSTAGHAQTFGAVGVRFGL